MQSACGRLANAPLSCTRRSRARPSGQNLSRFAGKASSAPDRIAFPRRFACRVAPTPRQTKPERLVSLSENSPALARRKSDPPRLFEQVAVCGSAPQYTGKSVINPLAAICAGQMMLDFLGETEAAKAIEDAVIKVTREKMKSLAAGKMGYSTSQVGDLVAATL